MLLFQPLGGSLPLRQATEITARRSRSAPESFTALPSRPTSPLSESSGFNEFWRPDCDARRLSLSQPWNFRETFESWAGFSTYEAIGRMISTVWLGSGSGFRPKRGISSYSLARSGAAVQVTVSRKIGVCDPKVQPFEVNLPDATVKFRVN
jgi:hypothetical protein